MFGPSQGQEILGEMVASKMCSESTRSVLNSTLRSWLTISRDSLSLKMSIEVEMPNRSTKGIRSLHALLKVSFKLNLRTCRVTSRLELDLRGISLRKPRCLEMTVSIFLKNGIEHIPGFSEVLCQDFGRPFTKDEKIHVRLSRY